MKKFLSDKQIKAIKDYGLAVIASAITMGVALVANLEPQYAVLIGSLALPLTKWANKHSKDYGPGSN